MLRLEPRLIEMVATAANHCATVIIGPHVITVDDTVLQMTVLRSIVSLNKLIMFVTCVWAVIN
jgi:hypothetical protein